MRRHILFFLFFLCPILSMCQGRHTVGFSANAVIEIPSHAYYYRCVGVEAVYRYAFLRASWCELQASAALHYTGTRYSAVAFPTDDYRDGYEVGASVGLMWQINIVGEYFRGIIGGYIGPMFTPMMPARQGGEVNFLDNLCIGFQVKLYRGLGLDVRYLYRHLSNANLAQPNYGLNDQGVGFGLFYKF